MIRKSILLLSLCAIISSCHNYDKIDNARWLVGRWENDSRAGKLVEEWSEMDDSMLIGDAFFIVGKDTVFSEDLQLKQEDSVLTYVAKVYGQNNDKPVSFKMTSSSKTQMVFENPQHDFPTKIVYNLIGKDSLVAEVSGIEKGQPKTETFRMKKK